MKKSLFIILMFTMFLASCKKEPVIVETKTMSELNVPSSFDWKTSKDYVMEVETMERGLFFIQSLDGKNYLKYFISNQSESIKFTVPSYEEMVIIKINNETDTVSLKENMRYTI